VHRAFCTGGWGTPTNSRLILQIPRSAQGTDEGHPAVRKHQTETGLAREMSVINSINHKILAQSEGIVKRGKLCCPDAVLLGERDEQRRGVKLVGGPSISSCPCYHVTDPVDDHWGIRDCQSCQSCDVCRPQTSGPLLWLGYLGENSLAETWGKYDPVLGIA
jgi:hypothetical protein